jgi:hypothetical protein
MPEEVRFLVAIAVLRVYRSIRKVCLKPTFYRSLR